MGPPGGDSQVSDSASGSEVRGWYGLRGLLVVIVRSVAVLVVVRSVVFMT